MRREGHVDPAGTWIMSNSSEAAHGHQKEVTVAYVCYVDCMSAHCRHLGEQQRDAVSDSLEGTTGA